MINSKFHLMGLLSILLFLQTNCKHEVLNYVGEFRVGEHTFPVAVRTINGIEVRYAMGLVNFTTNSDVTIEQLNPLVTQFHGEILQYWQPTGTKELDVLMRIPFSLDPFEVADQLNSSSLIRFAEPVFVSTPEGP